MLLIVVMSNFLCCITVSVILFFFVDFSCKVRWNSGVQERGSKLSVEVEGDVFLYHPVAVALEVLCITVILCLEHICE